MPVTEWPAPILRGTQTERQSGGHANTGAGHSVTGRWLSLPAQHTAIQYGGRSLRDRQMVGAPRHQWRVPYCVVQSPTEMRPIPHQRIPVLILPERPSSTHHPTHRRCTELLPRPDNVTYREISRRRKQHVHVIRHHHKRVEPIPNPIEMQDRVLDNLPLFRMSKWTAAMSCVQPLLDSAAHEPTIVNHLVDGHFTRYRMRAHPFVAQNAQFCQLLGGKRVLETKGDKSRHARLF